MLLIWGIFVKSGKNNSAFNLGGRAASPEVLAVLDDPLEVLYLSLAPESFARDAQPWQTALALGSSAAELAEPSPH